MATQAPIRHYASIDSTNLEAHRLAVGGQREALWIVADVQTSGRGRLHRRWQSPRGNLYATYLLPFSGPSTVVVQLGFAVALAVHDVALQFAPGRDVRLKWPNDCLVDGGKLAGILCETLSLSPLVIAIGCGINIASIPENLPYPAARLEGANVADVFAAYRTSLAGRLAQWDWGQGFASIAKDWQERVIGIGETVTLAEGKMSVSGVFTGIAEDGAMLIELETGKRRFYAGDVTIPSLEQQRHKRK